MKAVRIHQLGDPDVLNYEEIPMPEPGPGAARIEQQAVGVNFVDTYHRRGLYEQSLPFTPGVEGGGIVVEIGEGVADVSLGDRVAYAMQLGSYAEYAIVPAWRLVKIPDGIDIATATAVVLQGMTAHFLVRSTYRVREGETVLVHAAAGGVGLLLVQMAKLSGARVIGTVSTAEKAEVALELGADHIIRYSETDFVDATLALTGGDGVSVVYDGVGQATFLQGLNCLRPRGYMVLYGQASGPVAAVDPQLLNQKGSLFLTRPGLGDYTADRTELQARASEIFNWIKSGKLKVRIDRSFPLSQAAHAHRYIEDRRTEGKLLLKPAARPEPQTPDDSIDKEDPVDEIGWESFPASDPPPY